MSPVPAFEKGFVCIFVVCLSAMTMQLVGVRSATVMHFPINNDVPPGSQRTITWRGKLAASDNTNVCFTSSCLGWWASLT